MCVHVKSDRTYKFFSVSLLMWELQEEKQEKIHCPAVCVLLYCSAGNFSFASNHGLT